MGQKLGKYIKNIRREKKISVKALSSQAGISKSYLDYIESGAREPQVEMLAKIAVVLQTPLETMINIQKKEQLEAALTKLAVDGVTVSEEEFRAVARTADSGLTLDERALAQTQEAFRVAHDDKQLADFIENPDLKAIFRAGATLSDEDLDKLRKVMESLYPDAFEG
ncbi:helix-turn-helix transcriptional regulator [Enterocloster clostridioformis]|uniref:helix-turn-helix domain-containing protein n=1 Tax=Enterocloster clostridioformis TaxID=1531 RepID=UPI002674F8E9|nr:helix-turn-helix transcriptional regulator [Enterocloster clostridioformis]